MPRSCLTDKVPEPGCWGLLPACLSWIWYRACSFRFWPLGQLNMAACLNNQLVSQGFRCILPVVLFLSRDDLSVWFLYLWYVRTTQSPDSDFSITHTSLLSLSGAPRIESVFSMVFQRLKRNLPLTFPKLCPNMPGKMTYSQLCKL